MWQVAGPFQWSEIQYKYENTSVCWDTSKVFDPAWATLCLQLQRSKLANGTPDVEAGSGTAVPQGKWHSFISPVFIQALTLTFLAEWGDRSQLTTIILAAREVWLISSQAELFSVINRSFLTMVENCRGPLSFWQLRTILATYCNVKDFIHHSVDRHTRPAVHHNVN